MLGFWLLLLVHKHPIHALGGCIERERRGLLEFKAFLMLNNEDPDLLLPSWVDDESSNCCEWERVGCDPITGQVTGLYLNNTRVHIYPGPKINHMARLVMRTH